MSECCKDNQECCEPTQSREPCPVENTMCQEEPCCPADVAAKMNTKAFFRALHETQVDIMKEKIRGEWGDKMAKEADAVLKAMGAMWKAKLSEARAQKEMREDLAAILSAACEE